MTETLQELPEGWEWCELQDVAEVRLGRQRSPKNHHGDNMVPYLRAANVTWDGLDLSDVKEMNFTADEVVTYALRDGDIVLSEASGSASEVGKPAIWRGEIKTCCFQNTLIRVRSRGPLPDYLLLVLREAALRGAFVGTALGVGIHHLGSTRLARWPIPVPPVEIQAELVSAAQERLDEVAAGVAEVESALLDLDVLEASVRNRAVGGSAELVRLDEVAEIQSGLAKGRPKDGESLRELPYIRTANVQAGFLDLAEVKTIQVTAAQALRYALRAGDVLVLEGGDADKVGRGWIWDASIEPCLHQNHVFAVRPHDAVLSPRFLAHYINSLPARIYFAGCAKQTTNLASINKSQLRALPVPALPVEEQDRRSTWLDAALDELRAVRGALEEARAEAVALRLGVLRAAVSGRLRSQKSHEVLAGSYA